MQKIKVWLAETERGEVSEAELAKQLLARLPDLQELRDDCPGETPLELMDKAMAVLAKIWGCWTWTRSKVPAVDATLLSKLLQEAIIAWPCNAGVVSMQQELAEWITLKCGESKKGALRNSVAALVEALSKKEGVEEHLTDTQVCIKAADGLEIEEGSAEMTGHAAECLKWFDENVEKHVKLAGSLLDVLSSLKPWTTEAFSQNVQRCSSGYTLLQAYIAYKFNLDDVADMAGKDPEQKQLASLMTSLVEVGKGWKDLKNAPSWLNETFSAAELLVAEAKKHLRGSSLANLLAAVGRLDAYKGGMEGGACWDAELAADAEWDAFWETWQKTLQHTDAAKLNGLIAAVSKDYGGGCTNWTDMGTEQGRHVVELNLL